MSSQGENFGICRVTRFYVPLLVQAFTQSLTYPLVAGIVTHGELGVNALTAFSQGQMLMFMIGSIGGGLVTTGMIFARTLKGYAEFKRLNTLLMSVLLVAQCIPAMPPFSDWIFSSLFALPPELVRVARITLVGGVIMNGAFFLRNVPMVILFNRLESGKANTATMLRIAFTLACSLVFPRCGLVGPCWGLVALTLGCLVELAVTWTYARPYVRELPGTDAGEHVSLLEQLKFTLPLSLGGFLLMASPLLIAAFVGRSANAADMLAIHYVTLGVANPVAYGALRMQPVTIEFPPQYPGDRRLAVYALVAGALLGLVPFAFSLPAVGDWYFGVYQNLPARLLPTARLAIFIYSFVCIIHAQRARLEGIAAFNHRPSAVMAGQIAYTATLFAVLAITLPLGITGWAMAVTAIMLAPAATSLTVLLALRRSAAPRPVTRTSITPSNAKSAVQKRPLRFT